MTHASIKLDKDRVIAPIDPRLYGSFIEHLGRAVYTGIHEPGHPSADANGFRRDVIALVQELSVPVVRYPGGNFVSAYNWEDGIGPVEKRPRRLDLAWHTAEPNTVGIHEFAQWCEAVGTEMMLAVNLGSRGLDAARAFLEYCNHPGGSAWSDLRRANGRAEPWNVRLWCLGNEMDGPWQVGQKSAEEYGKLAHETAKAMLAFDPSLELVVCGSSNPEMPSYPQWEATVLEHTYEQASHISLHMYFNNRAGNLGNYLAQNIRLERYIETIAATIRYVKAKKRSKRDVTISFDEWNVWYHSREADKPILRGEQGWPVAPRLLEDIYNFEGALLVALIINSFIRHADVVKIACLAQLVNVIAPIMTEPGGAAWRQTIFHPFALASRLGRGKALDVQVSCGAYQADIADQVPQVDCAGVLHDDGGVALFLVNRGEGQMPVSVRLDGFAALRLAEHHELAGHGIKAANSLQQPEAVKPVAGQGARLAEGLLSLTLPPLSYTALRLAP